MTEQTPNKEIKDRTVRIKLIDGSQVSGQVNINRDPGYDRASDLVTSYKEPFLILFNVTVNPPDFENSIKHKTLFINKSHIIWAAPDETQK
ncbi:MAG: hypothetical protein KOO65_03820 [Desulfobacterales bacterium]|nr:hypothetical protein [Desulfobacterales bacterium]MBU8910376.1 hypothetical protein [Desulfobacterales bacterium]